MVTRVTRVTKVINLMNPRGTSLIPKTTNTATNRSRTRIFVQTSLVHGVVYMAIILVSVPSNPRCAKCGKPKQLLEVNHPYKNNLRIMHHLNWLCSQILFLSEDLLLLNLIHLKQLSFPNILVLVTIRSSWRILTRSKPLMSTCKLIRINMTSHWLCSLLSLKPKHLLSLLLHHLVRYISLNLNLSQFLRSQRDHYAIMRLLTELLIHTV